MRKYGKYERMPDGTRAKQPEPKAVLLQTYFTSLVCIILCVTMFFGTSYAWFTSEVVSEGNEIYIGTLDAKLAIRKGDDWKDVEQNPAVKLYDKSVAWEPGYTSLETLEITNGGDLSFRYALTFTDGKMDGTAENELRAIAEWFDVWVYHDSSNHIPTPASYAEITPENGWTPVGTLADVLGGKAVFAGSMEITRETAQVYTIALHMKGEQVDETQAEKLNALMGKTLALSVKLTCYQQDAPDVTAP